LRELKGLAQDYLYLEGFEDLLFLQDHTKVILCPLLGAVTYIDDQRMNRTFKFDLLEKFGCSQDVATRLSYAYDKVGNFFTIVSNPKSASFCRIRMPP
jgi:polo-like kinase 1